MRKRIFSSFKRNKICVKYAVVLNICRIIDRSGKVWIGEFKRMLVFEEA